MRPNTILRAIARRRDRSDAMSQTSDASQKSRRRQLGQVLPIFAIMSVVLIGGAALLTDVAWWWTVELKAQRAADAASLAGAVYLPNNESRAFAAALDEAEKNGFTNGVDGVIVTPRRDDNTPRNDRKLIVDIQGPVQTNFARVFCWDGGPCLKTVDVGVTSAAEFVLPVPMGSPENYYGAFGLARGLTSTATEEVPTADRNSSPWRSPTAHDGGDWSPSSGSLNYALYNDDGSNALASSNGAQHVWSGINAQGGMPTPGAGESLSIAGIEVRLSDVFINSSCSGGSARVGVELSWQGGVPGSWSDLVETPNLDTGFNNAYTLGNASNTSDWGSHSWTRDEFSDANFRMRLTATEGCTGSKTFRVDEAEVRITWDYSYTTTQDVTTNLGDLPLKGPGNACTTGKADCFEADGDDLNPRGFWGTLNTQGAENVNGDAHQPGYDRRTSTTSLECPADGMACYDADTYYNYAIEIPPLATGSVYIYDPQHCAVGTAKGTGDRWFSSGQSRSVSTFYTLYDTRDTLYDYSDDGLPVAGDEDLFRGIHASDSTMSGGTSGDECLYRTDALYGDGRDYHNRWYRLYDNLSGGSKGRVYRLHTSSTDPAAPNDQLGTDGENSFAIFVESSLGEPRVYGLGAMQAFTPLTASGGEQVSEFFLAQIEAAHKGKTLEIQLWDPGDTRPLEARLQILIPTQTGWVPTRFSYTASRGTSHSAAASCNSAQSPPGGTDIVTTNVGSTNGTFNGCWLTMRAAIPADYEAYQDGWWRIRYRMTGNGTSNDVTTWKVNLIGNPVHLVQP